MKMSELFDPEPQAWGLRGDPYLWQALREHLSDTDMPGSADEVAAQLDAAFSELVGVDLAGDQASSVHREEFAHGGMSSGMVSLDAWRQRLMPMLVERATKRL